MAGPVTELGMVGIGRMGGGMAARMRAAGLRVVGYDLDPARRDVASCEELVAALTPPRVAWLMLPAGQATEDAAAALCPLLQDGDTVVNGANDNFRVDHERARPLAEQGIHYIDAGVSGGVWGEENGYALMVGGDADDVARLAPVWEALAPEGGFVHAGPVGAGHFAKMVHNGVEYGMMQAYAEGFELLSASELGINVAAVHESWRHGSVVRSWLLDLLCLALAADPDLAKIRGYVEDTGEGRWTVDEAVRLGVPAPVMSASLFARFTSRQSDSPAMKVVAALRNQFGGHAVTGAD